MITSKKNIRSFLAYSLICTILFHMILTHPILTSAGEEHNITADDYTYNEIIDGYDLTINSDNIDQYSDIHDVVIPANYVLNIETDFSISGTLTIKDSTGDIAGGCLAIGGDGRFSGDINSEPEAQLLIENEDNIPEGITLYTADGRQEYSFVEHFWVIFIYDGTKWVDSNPITKYYFNTSFDGMISYAEEGTHYLGYRVTYTYEDVNDDNAEWFNPYEEMGITNAEGYVILTEDTEDNAYKDFSLDHFPGDDEHPWDDTDLAIRIEIWDDPISENYITKRIMDATLGYEGNINLMDVGILSDDRMSLTFIYADVSDESIPHDLHIMLAYPDEGESGIVDAANHYLYAYSGTDADMNKSYLARELYDRFIRIPLFGEFGLPITDLGTEDDSADFEAAIETLESRINGPIASDTIPVYLPDGTIDIRSVNTYRVTWGYAYNSGKPLTNDISVIELKNSEEFLVCTDFDNTAGMGTTYYARTANTDEYPFSYDNQDELRSCIIASSDYTNIVSGGNGAITTTLNTEGFYSFALNTSPAFSNIVNHGGYDTVVRIIHPDDTYIIVKAEGESKAHDGIGPNASYTDQVWITGKDAEARIYVGDTTAYIEPITSMTGVVTTGITNVALIDMAQRDGVWIDTSDMNKVKITFRSNFYDSVPIQVTYEDGINRQITLVRIGLVVQYQYLYGSQDTGVLMDSIYFASKEDAGISFKYNYSKGEQILVYATYYHPSSDLTASGGDDLFLCIQYDDGNGELLYHNDPYHNFDGYLEATDDAVATTSFLIGFMPAKEYDGETWTTDIRSQVFRNKYGNTGGFHAIVINDGFDDDTIYSGTQIGAGSGVYWDGIITQ